MLERLRVRTSDEIEQLLVGEAMETSGTAHVQSSTHGASDRIIAGSSLVGNVLATLVGHSVRMACTEQSDALRNVRDVGGLPLAGGGRVPEGVLLRSDAPHDGDRPPQIAGWPPHTVIDLRGSDEAGASHPLAGPDTEVFPVPLSADASLAHMLEDPAIRAGDLAALYRSLVRSAAPALVRIAALVAERPGPVLVHCTAGKDRTGVLMAVVLSAAGVERDAVVGDYAATDANMPGVLERIAVDPAYAGGPAEIRRLAAERPQLLAAPPRAIEAALDELERAGGAAAWLLANGIAEVQLAALRAKLRGP